MQVKLSEIKVGDYFKCSVGMLHQRIRHEDGSDMMVNLWRSISVDNYGKAYNITQYHLDSYVTPVKVHCFFEENDS